MRVEFSVDTGRIGGVIKQEFDFPDGTDDSFLDEMLNEWVQDKITSTWRKCGQNEE